MDVVEPVAEDGRQHLREAPVVSGKVIGGGQELEAEPALKLLDPGIRRGQGTNARRAGIDQGDQAVEPAGAAVDQVLLLDDLDEIDPRLEGRRHRGVARQEVEILADVGAVADVREEQGGLGLRRLLVGRANHPVRLVHRRIDQESPRRGLGALPQIGIDHHLMQVLRQFRQEGEGARLWH